MPAELSSAVCSITMTRRRRFFWAAWWSAPPTRAPFCKPDASNGGASTHEEAFAAASEAAAAAGRTLVLIEPDWARAWIRILRGQPAWLSATPPRRASTAHETPVEASSESDPASVWTILGAPPHANEADLKLAFRRRALETHPDHGGDPEAFRRLVRAYADARRRIRRPRRQR